MKRFRNEKGFTLIELIVVVVFLIGIVGTGWVKNIIKLTDCDFESPYKTEVIRVIGIIPPVGAVVGWLDIGEENKGGEDVKNFD